MKVFVIRHGETAWSLSGQHTGTTDIPLTDNGRRLAARIRPVLEREVFASVFTSPLQRARETCELAGLGAGAVLDADLVEWNYGEYEGLTPKQIHEKAPEPEAAASSRTAVMRPRPRVVEAAPGEASVRVHLVVPRSFNDAQQIADKFKDSIPVILNLQGADPELSKRLIDFTSGLTYALEGGMQRVADKVFMLTPRNVQVSAEERARLLERGFFNQA